MLVAMFVDFGGFRWLIKFSLRMGILEEQDGVALGVSWPLPSVHQMLALAATPMQNT